MFCSFGGQSSDKTITAWKILRLKVVLMIARTQNMIQNIVVQQMSTQCDHAQPVPIYRGAKYIVPDQAGEEDRDDNVGRTHSLTK